MIVTMRSLPDVIQRFNKPGFYALDTETTGLRVYHGDRLFSLILADDLGACYFNFQQADDIASEFVLPDIWEALQKEVFDVEDSVWCIHNAKFDMGMLKAEGVDIKGTIFDTEVGGRLLDNSHMTYGLDAELKRRGRAKNDTVKEHVKANKLYTQVVVPGRKQRVKMLHYDQVPWKIIAPYGLDDGHDALWLAKQQQADIEKTNETINSQTKQGSTGKFQALIENESKLIKTCFKMEQTGIKIDRGYCEQALEKEEAKIAQAAAAIEEATGKPFVDSAKHLSTLFTEEQTQHLRRTKTGISYDDTELGKLDSPLVPYIRQHRSSTKLSSTYYKNYLYHADAYNIIHPNMRQAGTATGRFSYSDPNLQNVPRPPDAEDQGGDESLAVRSCFVPRPEFCLGMIDYDQMEYRLMLNYAKELGVIKEVLSGLDVHQATANTMGVGRYEAKTINFMLLYGGGAQKLADALGVTLEEAKRLKQRYFRTLPQVASFIRKVIDRVESRGYLYNWMGRPYNFPLRHNPRTGRMDRFGFKGPNYLIQGGCSDIVRLAMNRIDDLLTSLGAKSRMILQVHDELVFEIHKTELDIMPELKRIMEEAYPAEHLPLTCGVDHSWRSWGEKTKGYPKILGAEKS